MKSNNEYHQIFTTYYRKILYYCLNQNNKNKEDAEDCTQDVFFVLWEKYDNLNLENISAWLYRVADNVIKRYKRKNKNHRRLDELPEETLIDYSIDDMDTKIEIDDILSSLNSDERKLIADYYMYGKTVTELAKEFKTSTAAIYQRLSRIKSKIVKRANAETSLCLL